MKRFFRCQSGTSLIEFAFALPLMLMLLLGTIEMGRYTYFSILASNAARAGAQYGAQNLLTAYDYTGIQNAAVADGQNLPNWTTNHGSVTPNAECAYDGAQPGQCSTPWGSSPPQNTIYYVQVVVVGYFPSLFHYPGIPDNIPITGSATMRVATQ